MTLIRELIEISEHVQRGAFVLRRTEGVAGVAEGIPGYSGDGYSGDSIQISVDGCCRLDGQHGAASGPRYAAQGRGVRAGRAISSLTGP